MLAEIQSRIEEPTLGKWKGMALAVAKKTSKENSAIPEIADYVNDTLVPFLDGPLKKRTPETSFSDLRNLLAHGGGVTKAIAAKLLTIWEVTFEDIILKSSWFAELTWVVKSNNGDLKALRGAERKLENYTPSNNMILIALQEIFSLGEEVALVRGDTVFPLWPLNIFGIPRSTDPDSTDVIESVPQIYIRRGEVWLQYTPIGSEEICQCEGDEKSLATFTQLFQIDKFQARHNEKKFDVRGFEPDIYNDAGKLIGRVDELSIIRKKIKQTSQGVLWLTGPAGIGKSYLVAQITTEFLDSPSPKTLVFPFRFKAGDERCSRDSFLKFAIERLKALKGATLKEENKKNSFKLVEKLRLLLESISDHRIIFILDGLDEVVEKDPMFPKEIPLGLSIPNVTWFCAGRPEGGLPEVFSSEQCTHIFLKGVPPMGAGDIRSMLLEKIGPLRRRLLLNDHEEGDKVVNPFINKVIKCSDGFPIYVKYLIGDILSNRFRSLDAGERLPPSLEKYHEDLIKRYSFSSLNQIIPPIISFISLSKEPISRDTIYDYLVLRNIVTDREESKEATNKALSLLSTILRRSILQDHSDGYTIFHHSLRNHIFESELTRISIDTAKRSLCDLFFHSRRTVKKKCELRRRESALEKYFFRWGIQHLIDNNQTEFAAEALKDPIFHKNRGQLFSFDFSIQFLFRDLCYLSNVSQSLTLEVLSNYAFTKLFAENRRYFHDHALFISMKELGFENIINNMSNKPQSGSELQVATIYYYYITENFEEAIKKSLLLINSQQFAKISDISKSQTYDLLGMSYRKHGLYGEARKRC
jgi:hypothetical protein